MKYVILFIVVLCITMSCGSSKEQLKVLDLAEHLIDIDADSACTILSTLSLNSVQGDESKARYALLYSKALDKNYVKISHDSLASFAANYYESHGSNREKAMAYYYLSRVHENKNDFELSVKNLTLAEEIVPSDNYELKGLIHNAFGSKYISQISYNKALKHFQLSVNAFEVFDKKRYGYALFNLGSAVHNLKKYNDALEIYDKALNIFEELNDTTLIYKVHRNIAITKMRTEIPISHIKKELFGIYNKYNNGKIRKDHYRLWSLLYSEEANIDSARYYFYKFKNQNFTHAYIPKNRLILFNHAQLIEYKAGNYKKALKYADSRIGLMDSIHKVEKRLIIQDLNEKYKNELHKEELIYLEEKLEYQITIFIFLIILIILIFYTIHKLRISQKEKKLILKQEEIEDIQEARSLLREHYDEEVRGNEIKEKEIIRQQEILTTMQEAEHTLKSYYEGVIEFDNIKRLEYETTSHYSVKEIIIKIATLNEQYIKYETMPKEFSKVFYKTMNISSNTETRELMYSLVNIEYNNLLTYLAKNYKLAPRELDLCCMICMGYSNTCINGLLGFSNRLTIYNYRSLLRHKLNLKSEKIDLYVYFNELKNTIVLE